MEPVFLDLHIHTSKDPNSLNPNYDIDKLISKIDEFTDGSTFLISLTDHNTINKPVYLEAQKKVENLLLGVELHIQNYSESPAYHCHIYFNCTIETETIDDINEKLDDLYPDKKVRKRDENIPTIQEIINTFDSYEFMLLPHGGQSHCTFDNSIPEGVKFDSTMERSIYYNQFDGFTARGDTGLERTQEYFKRLGIHEFVNLVTCTDNYVLDQYPSAKSSEASPFVPTWMLALPTFNGLRLSLSERSRLVYSDEKPSVWSEYIRGAKLIKEIIKIDVELTSGLNVVIGGSSSGKTLFVDSLYRTISNNLQNSEYSDFEVKDLQIDNPSAITPHYLPQNYIMRVLNKTSDESIGKLEIVKKVFPGDDSIRDKVDKSLVKLKGDLKKLVRSIKTIEEETDSLSRIPILSKLVVTKEVKENILERLSPSDSDYNSIEYSQSKYENHREVLNEIDTLLNKNPIIDHDEKLISELKAELQAAHNSSEFEASIRKIINEERKLYDETLKSADRKEQTKRQEFEKLLNCVKSYSESYREFKETVKTISEYSTSCGSEEIKSMGHKLSIQNDFELNKTKFLEIVNHYLKTNRKVESFKSLTPEKFFEENFKKQSPKVYDYEDFERKIYSKFENLNNKTYKIVTADGKPFEKLSAGWKTSVLLDIILGYEEDMAPIIIDQPEDNLATNYINKGLVNAIKKIKSKKQVILVSHNATIPMLADAQNIVLCRNDGDKITIQSNRLEGEIDNTSVLDYVARITDGGKSSVKKRVKKYNLKKFKKPTS